MIKFSELALELESLLRLKISPVGIKLFPKIADIPKEFEVMKTTCTVCQVIAKARFHETGVATTRDAVTACGLGGGRTGLLRCCPRCCGWDQECGRLGKNCGSDPKISSG